MKGIIYIIKNNINGKVYIGQTIQKLKDRWYRHCGKSGLSKNELNMHIKRAIFKYGKENFTIEVLEECDQCDLNEREKYYIKSMIVTIQDIIILNEVKMVLSLLLEKYLKKNM